MCNNRITPWWGATFTPFQRLIQAQNVDSYEISRVSASNIALQAAFKITRAFPNFNHRFSDLNGLFIWLGQLINHDLSFTIKFDKQREQYSRVSHWLDLDNLYGSNEKEAKSLRSFRRGQLKTYRVNFNFFSFESEMLNYFKNVISFCDYNYFIKKVMIKYMIKKADYNIDYILITF